MQKLKWDFVFTIMLVALIGVGFSYIFSASSIFAMDAFGNMYYFLTKQVINIILGIVVIIVVAKIPYQKIRPYIPILNLITIILMSLPLVPGFGVSKNGAERWINLFGFSFQPSELAKITIIVTIAHMIEMRKRLGILNNLKKGIGPILGYLAAYAALLLLVQKHLSATMLIMLVSGTLLLVGGINKKNIVLLSSVAGGLVVAAIALEPFRMARILGFLHPEDDPNGKGFHVLQSWKALGSGEFFGLGLGMSRQKFGWLPENHTDFIMAIIGEESGFLGVILIIGLFLILVIQGILISAKAPDRFGLLMGTGISLLIFFQAFINMAVVSGMFPVTGVPLPFISYGGTSTIILMIGIGLIFNIISQTKK